MQKLFFCAYIREKIDRFAVDSTLSVDCRIHFTTESHYCDSCLSVC